MAASAKFYLAKHCFACRTQGYWIILDTKHDKYIGVTHEDLVGIGSALHGWLDTNGSDDIRSSDSADRESLLGSLLAGGIITSDPNHGKNFVASGIAGNDLVDNSEGVDSNPVTLRTATKFFIACIKVDWHLRLMPLANTLARIRTLRSNAIGRTNAARCSKLAAALGSFQALRPYYPRPYLCLFDSLALLEYLADCHIFPNIVFGVIANPFQAHCWVQDRSTVLNDDVERVRRYTPILTI